MAWAAGAAERARFRAPIGCSFRPLTLPTEYLPRGIALPANENPRILPGVFVSRFALYSGATRVGPAPLMTCTRWPTLKG